MSGSNNSVEWVQATEEVVESEECLSTVTSEGMPVIEEEKTPIQKLLDTVGQGDNPENEEGFCLHLLACCDECLGLFQDQSDPDNPTGPSYILDFPASMGIPQRALLTLPYGLTVARSSIPNAGVGIINHGPVVSPGMHFGPYEGELTTMENASDFSWEIYKDKDQYEYIDAAKDSHSNWMRYINFARNEEETNLLAVQYKGSILYHCCRTIHAGEELLVWPSSKLLSGCSETWSHMWFLRLHPTDSDPSSAALVFQCSHCQLAFTTESFLQRHVDNCHAASKAGDAATGGGAASTSAVDLNPPAASLVVLSLESSESKKCGDCGKVFKQRPHLRRHKRCVHSNKRPYCCPHCRRSFSQASGLVRHQLVHQKQAEAEAPSQSGDAEQSGTTSADAAAPKETDRSETASAPAGEAEAPPVNCSDCGKSFRNEASLKKHKVTVHERLRPYVCTMCQKCFGQYHDLTRHLQCHQKQKNKQGKAKKDPKRGRMKKDPKAAAVLPFSCAECSLTFSSVDVLQEHVNERHSQENPAESQEDDPVVEAVPQVPSQRPQRLGARSKVSAITKLIAPKRRAASPSESEDDDPENGKVKKSKWFSCNHCKRTYGDPEDLKAHKCAPKRHKCGQCAEAFSKPSSLKAHELAAHEKEMSFSCERCEKAFTSASNLKQHQKSNTCMKYHCTSELFPCAFCQFSFTVKSYLLKHIKRHHPVEYLSHCESDSFAHLLEDDEEEQEQVEQEYLCPHCGQRCADHNAFKSHTCFRQVKVLYLCTDCGKGFMNHYSLKQHQRIHTGEKPFSCTHCSKSFSYVGQLNVHVRTHTGEKPYLCTHCGESFRQSGDLKRHERKHTGVRPYSCPECNKSFSRPQSLKAHQMLHKGQRMFKCTDCGKSFSRNYHLRRHHQKMHM